MEDVDSYAGVWVHWIAWNIHPDDTGVSEGVVPEYYKEGKNSFGKLGYGGPCPHEGDHRYYFRLYALDERFKVPEGIDWAEYEIEMAGHVVDRADLMATYSRE
jgi:hypothetical protein